MLEVDVRQSGIWQTNSTILSASGEALVVDPAFFPRELDDLARLAEARGAPRAVVFTHGHWDHVAGWAAFPSAPVYGSARLAAAVAAGDAAARENLAALADFDARWYVPRPAAPAWPTAIRALAEGARTSVGPHAIEALHLPGHSDDGLGLLVRDAGLLLVGDYLSPCEIPFVDELAAYVATLGRLGALLDVVDAVIPGHGPRLGRSEARAILDADRAYLEALRSAPDLAAALAVRLPRAAGVPGMREHHRTNCAAAGHPTPGAAGTAIGAVS